MREHELSDWRGALATARLAPNTGMVPLKSSTLLAAQAEIDRLRAALAVPASECTHQCRKCMHRYIADGKSEDCPVCGHDGLGGLTTW